MLSYLLTVLSYLALSESVSATRPSDWDRMPITAVETIALSNGKPMTFKIISIDSVHA